MRKKKNKLNFVQKILIAVISSIVAGVFAIIVALIGNNSTPSDPPGLQTESNSSNTSTPPHTTEMSKATIQTTTMPIDINTETSEPVVETNDVMELFCDGARVMIFDNNTCTAYIDDEYIKTHAIGDIKDNRKIIGWSVTFTTPYDMFELIVQLDWEIPNNKSTMRGVVALNNEQLVEQDSNITLNIYNNDVQILFDSTTLPIDLAETYQICINDLFDDSLKKPN